MLRVITTNPTGGGYDITQMIDGLRWSSVNPGGDESANFTFKQPWSRDNVEIARGSIVRIEDGLERCFTGRIEELDRGGDAAEEVAVTAYGPGIRLKDNTMVEVYADRDLSRWTEPSRQRRINLLAAFGTVSGPSVEPDTTTALPALALTLEQAKTNPMAEALYDAGAGVLIGSIYYDMTSLNTTAADSGFIAIGSDDVATLSSGTADLLVGVNSAAAGTLTPTTPYRFGFINLLIVAVVGAADRSMTVRRLAVFGNHGLTKRGTAPNEGFFDSDIVANVLSRVPGVVAGKIDAGSFIISHAIYPEPVDHESVISDVSKYESRDWGTWGQDGIFDDPAVARFDYKLKDPRARQWSIRRADCANLDLHTEMSTLFDTVVVSYQDAAGTAQTVTRTRTSPELIAAGMSPKTAPLQASSALTQASAEVLGDVFLALSGAFAPARGSVQIEGTIDHLDRGKLPARFMRADGSNLQIPDILPSTTMLALDDTPDRRTTFPIKRVSHDASGTVVSTTVELDQTNDALSQLQNRLDIDARRVLG